MVVVGIVRGGFLEVPLGHVISALQGPAQGTPLEQTQSRAECGAREPVAQNQVETRLGPKSQVQYSGPRLRGAAKRKTRKAESQHT